LGKYEKELETWEVNKSKISIILFHDQRHSFNLQNMTWLRIFKIIYKFCVSVFPINLTNQTSNLHHQMLLFGIGNLLSWEQHFSHVYSPIWVIKSYTSSVTVMIADEAMTPLLKLYLFQEPHHILGLLHIFVTHKTCFYITAM
jgi:hypothetical protein